MVRYKFKSIWVDIWGDEVNPLGFWQYKFKCWLIEHYPRAKSHKMVGRVYCEDGEFRQVVRYLSDSLWAYQTIEFQPPSEELEYSYTRANNVGKLQCSTVSLRNKRRLYSEREIYNNLNTFFEEKSHEDK